MLLAGIPVPALPRALSELRRCVHATIFNRFSLVLVTALLTVYAAMLAPGASSLTTLAFL
jgi:hypothetical protein